MGLGHTGAQAGLLLGPRTPGLRASGFSRATSHGHSRDLVRSPLGDYLRKGVSRERGGGLGEQRGAAAGMSPPVPETVAGDWSDQALYEEDDTLPPWPVQLVWINCPGLAKSS